MVRRNFGMCKTGKKLIQEDGRQQTPSESYKEKHLISLRLHLFPCIYLFSNRLLCIYCVDNVWVCDQCRCNRCTHLVKLNRSNLFYRIRPTGLIIIHNKLYYVKVLRFNPFENDADISFSFGQCWVMNRVIPAGPGLVEWTVNVHWIEWSYALGPSSTCYFLFSQIQLLPVPISVINNPKTSSERKRGRASACLS